MARDQVMEDTTQQAAGAAGDPARMQGEARFEGELRKPEPEPAPVALGRFADTDLYRALRDAIDSGQYAPGDRLPPERDLEGRFAASRSAVRKAVQRLEREGRIYRHVGRGTFVKEPSGGMTRPTPVASPIDVLEARWAIEPGFADLVVSRATQEDFAELETQLARMDKAHSQQDFREAGYAFHLAIARATRNPLLIRFFELIVEARAAAGWGKLPSLNDTMEARMKQAASNREILGALQERDAATLRSLLREHLGRMVAAASFQR